MISLILNKAHEFKVGEILHLRVASIYQQAPGKWRLEVEDVTPLPGHEPTGYACGVCGIVEAAKDDGSLPDGWEQRLDKEGGHSWLCASASCKEATCSAENPCCSRRDEYNGFSTGSRKFTCPKHCSCHD